MIDVETIFYSDREEYEFMQQKKEQPMKEQNREITEIELMAIDIDKLFYEAEIKQTLPKKHPSIVKAEHLYNAGYRKQKEVELREEVTTDDFHDLELAKERGYHRKKFYCPNCDLLIKTETWDSKYMFGNSTVLKTNEMPKFCPNCGAKMKGGAK